MKHFGPVTYTYDPYFKQRKTRYEFKQRKFDPALIIIGIFEVVVFGGTYVAWCLGVI